MSTAKKVASLIVIAIIAFTIMSYTSINTYINSLKYDTITVQKSLQSLEGRIRDEAKKRQQEPQDATIDRVWKTTPGYNGVKVDVEKSLKNMKKDGIFVEKHLIYRQIPPKKHLKDLPPAPIYRGHPDKPMIAFGINVAWGEEYLPDMLATLKKHQIHATFFFEGKWVKKHPDLAKMIVKAGHEAGNHSYSHPDMAVLSANKTKEEMVKTNEVIEAITGHTPKLFAPPSGSFNEQTIQEAHKLGMLTTLWTVDTIDWRKPTPNALIERVMDKVHPGAIILMHPTKSSSASLNTLIQEIEAKDFKIGTVSNLLSETRILK
ncbi:polysaccharide deacetylase family protein [Bacillus sp. REN10]|uniref:polysaccharide deacetylase family protein n=1 Tax=Bacillus sp. REN10 TaxID=2782541 RepID=UPI00193AE6B0|nr:polysaccharide deacetylase family protein [Bacillus sp. REN10]